MPAESIDHKLQELEENLSLLLQLYQKKEQVTHQLQQTNANLEQEVKNLKNQLADFQNQYKIAKIVSGSKVEKEESVELKHKLNEYIKEIDRCIAHLS